MARIKVWAHRGCGKGPIENTLRAIREGFAAGADGIELDVRVSREREIVLMHDVTVERLTNGTGRVEEMTLEQLKQLKIGPGETIPTLQEAISEVKKFSNCYLNLDVKVEEIERPILDMLRDNDVIGNVIISSHNYRILKAVRKRDNEMETGLIVNKPREEPVQLAINVGATALHPAIKLVSDDLVDRCHRSGLQINPWSVNNEKDMHRMIALGVDNIITDYPSHLRMILDKEGM